MPEKAIVPLDIPAEDIPTEPEKFGDVTVSGPVAFALKQMGYTEPTPIQTQVVPIVSAGHDVVGQAQTGTGKTASFGIPIVEIVDPTSPVVQALILTPTRELAMQVSQDLTDIGRYRGVRSVTLYGGQPIPKQIAALERHPQVIIATPGRLMDLMQRGNVDIRNVKIVVLDEADQMLDIGFMPDIVRILSRTPRRRQTALFSATMPTQVMRLVRRFMESPVNILVSSELETVASIEQSYVEVARRDKVRGLKELIDRELRGRTLVFCNTRRGVDMLAERLQGLGVRVGALHGDMDQRHRDHMVQGLRDGGLDILVATNVAARGLDIPEITHVVNFDVPQNAEEYVHRVGRTGRAGRAGKAITFVSEADLREFDVLLGVFGEQLHGERLELYA